jgi:hypothetical protein
MTGVDWRVGRELTGSRRVLTGTGERTWVECDSTVNELPSVNDTGSEQCSRGVSSYWGFDGRGQKSEDSPRFPAPYKHYGFYTT